MELELCTCPVGHSGAPCKHQAAIVQNYNITSINFLPTTAEMIAW
ncbi:SWIM zinc finger family protein [Enterococcus larvae]